MISVPRSRWLALLVAALLCVLGGANRGQVPAHEREGSRTADEPAALSMRRGVPEVAESPACGDDDRDDPDCAPDLVVRERTTGSVVHGVVASLVLAPPQPLRGCVSSRGPPHSASLV
jgi:hypothetical protein